MKQINLTQLSSAIFWLVFYNSQPEDVKKKLQSTYDQENKLVESYKQDLSIRLGEITDFHVDVDKSKTNKLRFKFLFKARKSDKTYKLSLIITPAFGLKFSVKVLGYNKDNVLKFLESYFLNDNLFYQ